ncbi:MAG: zinc ribbon domain-containing protein [Candidatus Asgardarchaeia archaeon]
MTKICPYCKAENPDDAKYCINCGRLINLESAKIEHNEIVTYTYFDEDLTNKFMRILRKIEYRDSTAWLLLTSGIFMILFTVVMVVLYLTYVPVSIFGFDETLSIILTDMFLISGVSCYIWFYKLVSEVSILVNDTKAIQSAEIEFLRMYIPRFEVEVPKITLDGIVQTIIVALGFIPILNVISYLLLIRKIEKHIKAHEEICRMLIWFISLKGDIQVAKQLNQEINKIRKVDNFLATVFLLIIPFVGMIYILYLVQDMINKIVSLQVAIIKNLSQKVQPPTTQ